MKDVISVIIPVYNVEKYIRECLDSIINQTYSNLQIILIDDGSTDNSGKICDEYAENDNRIQVIHQDNQGAGGAKNTGLDFVKGEYFSIIDSDDYLELNYYEKMMSELKKHNVDIVQCLFSNTYVCNKVERNYVFNFDKDRIITAKKYLFEMLYDWKYAVLFNKIYSSSLLNKDIRFPVGRKIDDEFFTYKLICNSKRILNINDKLYNYRIRKSSVMNDTVKERLLSDRIDCFEERLKYIENYYPNLVNDFYNHLAEYLLFYKNSNEYSNCIDLLNKYIQKYPIKHNSCFKKINKRIKTRNMISDRLVLTGEYFD